VAIDAAPGNPYAKHQFGLVYDVTFAPAPAVPALPT